MSEELPDTPPAVSPMREWLAFRADEKKNTYYFEFHDQLIGNPMIRSVHGGATATLVEMSCEHALQFELGPDVEIQLASSSIDYFRVTKDVDMHARAQIVRLTRRLAFVDVWCWQDNEAEPVARGTCTLRLFRK